MLANRLALVTGGASGIGYSIAQLFAKNGAHIALADMSPKVADIASELSKSSKNSKITAHTLDVSDSSQVNNLFNEINEQHSDHKFPTVVVNSAGIVQDGYMAKMTEENFDKVIRVNLKGTFLVTQAASKALIANYPSFDGSDPNKTFASIVNLSSVIGKYGAMGQSNYAASKAGVDGFTKSCSKELGKFKIRCNTIQPGFVQTPMTEFLEDHQRDMILMFQSLKRLGNPEDIAQLALFLASDNSSYITGSTVECNGGMVI